MLVGAHHDHVGHSGRSIYRGADDNAAAVGILLEVARALRQDAPRDRGVLFAAFDGEEPPYFLSEAMGSEHFALHPTVPLDTIDLMVCMDLVGHALGPDEVPGEVRQSVFALGAERSEGTGALVDRLARAETRPRTRRTSSTTPRSTPRRGGWSGSSARRAPDRNRASDSSRGFVTTHRRCAASSRSPRRSSRYRPWPPRLARRRRGSCAGAMERDASPTGSAPRC
ncbi:M28 family peptidase [Archangium violaceum]|nr:M28 family peptidase [Archangium violaceum]